MNFVSESYELYPEDKCQELVKEGLSQIKAGKVSSALKIFKEIQKFFPNYSKTHLYLANLYSIQNEKQEALKSYTLAWEQRDKFEEQEEHYVPYQSIFILLSMDQIPKDLLKTWIDRAEEYYFDYSRSKRMIIDFAKQVLQNKND
jgi:tetratricopeptide (TPR) repeat protein